MSEDQPGKLESLDREAWLSRLSIALVRTAYPGNLGAVARVMTNFGVRHGTLVSPRCDMNSVEARQYATGPSALTLATMNIVKSMSSCISGYSSVIGLTRRTGQMRKASIGLEDVAQRLKDGRVLLVFGPEDDGLSDADIKECTDILTLDVSPSMPSLNLSHAVAVVLSRLYSQLNSSIATDGSAGKLVSSEALLALFRSFESTLKQLEISGKLTNSDRLCRLLSQSISRARLDDQELAAWHGFLSALK